ncbi:hypothetical protein V6N12_036436 [Hibiscus sabdariffa]|uniref:BURP domain-containing protein n=1 Tax=Hibiscus sabdariffa TaxID=183260 RepID=A0ABR2EQQ3_9ROSI
MSMKLSFRRLHLLQILVLISSELLWFIPFLQLKSEVQVLEHVVDDDRQIEGDSRVETRVDSVGKKYSQKAKAIEATLRECVTPTIKGEIKYCGTSVESMLDFASSVLGPNSGFKIFATKYHTKSSTLFQNYTNIKSTELDTSSEDGGLSHHALPLCYPILP